MEKYVTSLLIISNIQYNMYVTLYNRPLPSVYQDVYFPLIMTAVLVPSSHLLGGVGT